ncbi:MAG: 30S ribosome-binding factor RbfA [Rikenellaceae bacterium]|jgi:ribosome-binding factor A|nr:30S ribosome-binding factor RbfA [Rikenellaceae bacterium]
METTRQLKVARQIQKDISEILLREGAALFPGVMVSVTIVRVSPDLGFAKVFLSVFPFEKRNEVMETVAANAKAIRHTLGGKLKHQLRTIPELAFHIDDSLEYISNIDSLLDK